MTDLSGNLATFGLRRVLEFLAEAGQTGEFRASTNGIEGRVLLQDGVVAYATNASGADAVHELDTMLERLRNDATDHPSVGDLGGDTAPTPEEALADQLTEVLYHLAQAESGEFHFNQSIGSGRDRDVHTFTVEDLLARVDRRSEEWRQIREVVPSTETAYRLVSQLTSNVSEVTLDRPTWRMLAAIDGDRSVKDVASTLNVYEFHAARKFADLVKQGLLEPVGYAARILDSGSETQPEVEERPASLDRVASPVLPRVQPATHAVTFSQADLSREEMDEVIRNIGRGIYPD